MINERLAAVMAIYPSIRDENRRLGRFAQRKLADSLRGRLSSVIYSLKKKRKPTAHLRNDAALKYLGCTLDELKIHIEARFTEGMTWLNHGEWHIDHKRPVASFFLEEVEQMRLCFHYSNLQPMWGPDNCSKGATWDGVWTDPSGEFTPPPMTVKEPVILEHSPPMSQKQTPSKGRKESMPVPGSHWQWVPGPYRDSWKRPLLETPKIRPEIHRSRKVPGPVGLKDRPLSKRLLKQLSEINPLTVTTKPESVAT